jgi:Na+/melibiose symporter-like transporter
MTNLSPTKPLHWYDHISINLYWLGLNIRNNAVGTVFMPFLVFLFAPEAIKNTALGEMRTVGLIIAMLVQPAAGLLSDRSTSRFGRRRPFIFVGVILDLLFLAAIGLSWDYWSLLIAILLIQFSGNISHGALQALIPDLVPENQRGVASGVKALMELLPLILVSLVIANMVGNGQFGLAIVVTGIGLLITMLLTMILVKEVPLTVKPVEPIGPPMRRVFGILLGILAGGAAGLVVGGIVGGMAGLITWPISGGSTAMQVGVSLGGLIAMTVGVVIGVWGGALATLGQDARKNSSFTWWVVNRLFFLAAVTSIQGFAPYFLMYVFNITIEAATSLNGKLMLVVGLFTMASAIPGGMVSDKIGHKRLVGISGILAALGTFILMSAILSPSMSVIYVAGSVLGVATGIFTATNWAMGTRLIPSAEAGRYLGISNLAGAGAGMIGAGMGGPIADYLNGYFPGLGYFIVFGCYGIMFILSTLTLRWIRK